MSPRYAIGIDLGGTNIKAGLVDRAGRVAAKLARDCEPQRGPDCVISDIAAMCRQLLSARGAGLGDVVGIGLGSPGPLDLDKGLILKSANLPGWHNVSIRDRVAAQAGLPVVLNNDANAAAFGEFWAGAGREGGDMVMFTLGTGVGGGVILDGKLLHGSFANAGELGHMIVVPEGLACPCGQRGCLEQYASAGAVARRLTSGRRDDPGGRPRPQVADGRELTARDVVDAAQAGDPLASRIWSEACRYLAIACVNVQHAFNPATIVLGGGLAEAGAVLIDAVRDEFRRQSWSLCEDQPMIIGAALGYDAGVIGAAGLAWTSLSL
jgi:glucokinase